MILVVRQDIVSYGFLLPVFLGAAEFQVAGVICFFILSVLQWCSSVSRRFGAWGLSMKKILVVDDDIFILEMIGQALESAEYACVKCTSVEDALSQMQSSVFDAVISDVNMPGKDGLEFAREIRGQGHDVALLMISGEDFGRDKANYLNSICLYADDVLGKPFTRERLLGAVEEIIRNRPLATKYS